MASIKFTKDFANKKKGDVWENAPQDLAARLILRKVAKPNFEAKAKAKSKAKK